MLRSWKVGTLFGIDLYVNWTFLLPPLIAWRIVANEEGDYQLATLYAIGVVFIFGCVMLHELGHALMARVFGIQTKDITLYPIGGIARLERMSEKPWEEFWIAIAGPAVNVAIAALLFLLFVLCYSLSPERLGAWLAESPKRSAGGLLAELFKLVLSGNLFLVFFNMLPAFPMDGGRVLRALLSRWLGHLRATEIAAALGVVMVGLFVLAGLGVLNRLDIIPFEGSPMLVLVALFVFIAGQQELALVRQRAARAAQGVPVTLQPADGYHVVGPDLTPPEPNFSGFTWDRRAGLWIEWRDGRPFQGCFTE
jgi:Zn-dependent protease